LTPEEGDTAVLLRESGGATIVDLADEELIEATLPKFIGWIRNRAHPLADPAKVENYARSRQALELALCLNGLAGAPGDLKI
jgi:hypothetical protein